MAAIDVGTNSIHMVVVRVMPSLPAFNIIAREKDTVRLGDRDPKTGTLTPAAIDRALASLRRCHDLAAAFNAEQIVALATSAVREAPNGRDFIQLVRRELGITIDLISGQEEARRIYLGVLSAMEFSDRPHIIVDIGGGSTEIVLGDGREPRYLSSTKVGAVRLKHRYITNDPIARSERRTLETYIRGQLARATSEVRARLQPGEKPTLVGTSGTIECLANLHARETLGIVPNPLQGYELCREDLDALVDRLADMTEAERLQLPGMSDRRAEIIVPGALVLVEAMRLLDLDRLVVCERALREGAIVDWMLAHGLIENHLRFHNSVRQRSTLNIANKYRVDITHGERVARFALSLFDQTHGNLHQWGAEERELLWTAAVLHNCGIYVSHDAHHKHSYYLIRNAELMGFNETELELVANIARYHRKSKPKKKHESYSNLPGKRYREMVDQLSALLRLATALDRRQIGAIATVRCQYDAKQRGLHIHVMPARADDDCELELWSLSEKKAVFEEVFDIAVETAICVP
ncbi:Ppx/GppA phosphatase family protein [Rubidibacter lacunae]